MRQPIASYSAGRTFQHAQCGLVDSAVQCGSRTCSGDSSGSKPRKLSGLSHRLLETEWLWGRLMTQSLPHLAHAFVHSVKRDPLNRVGRAELEEAVGAERANLRRVHRAGRLRREEEGRARGGTAGAALLWHLGELRASDEPTTATESATATETLICACSVEAPRWGVQITRSCESSG